ncbi:hypothetical protein [Paraburkholderia caffeinilytica]|uniref:hypothetical protein n=1 Tax=Paraburkholderia caffeinilytica TaxID=1761016 RepID=UPI0038B9C866
MHTLHQDAADHTAPTYETYVHDFIPFEWKLPRIFARSDRAGKMSGHDGRSAFRDRFRGNRFNERFNERFCGGKGELNRTGRFAVQFRNRGDLSYVRHRYNIHENRNLATSMSAAIARNTRESACFKADSRFKGRFDEGSAN